MENTELLVSEMRRNGANPEDYGSIYGWVLDIVFETSGNSPPQCGHSPIGWMCRIKNLVNGARIDSVCPVCIQETLHFNLKGILMGVRQIKAHPKTCPTRALLDYAAERGIIGPNDPTSWLSNERILAGIERGRIEPWTE